MRIAYICADPGVPVFGRKGCSIHVQEFLRALITDGAEVSLFARRQGGELPEGLEGLVIHALPPDSHFSPLLGSDYALREQSLITSNKGLREALESEGPFDLVYERYSLWSFAAMEYARDNAVPGLLEVNAPLIEEQSQYRVLVDNAGAEDVARKVFDAATALIAVSGEVADYLERRGVSGDRIFVVPNGVDPERFSSENNPLTLALYPKGEGFSSPFVSEAHESSPENPPSPWPSPPRGRGIFVPLCEPEAHVGSSENPFYAPAPLQSREGGFSSDSQALPGNERGKCPLSPEGRGQGEGEVSSYFVRQHSLNVSPGELIPGRKFTIGFVGSLKPWHGLDNLVEAFDILHSQRPYTHLLIIGDGKEKARLMEDIEARQLTGSVTFTGAVSHSEVPKWLMSMDVAVAPYPDMPGFYFSPLKVFEYMAAGLPIVAGRIGQIKRLIDDEINGLLCTPGDPKALASAIERLYEDERLRNSLGCRARTTVLEKYTWQKVVKRVMEIAGFRREIQLITSADPNGIIKTNSL